MSRLGNAFQERRDSSALIESDSTSSSSSFDSTLSDKLEDQTDQTDTNQSLSNESEVIVVHPNLENTVDESNTAFSITNQDISMTDLDNMSLQRNVIENDAMTEEASVLLGGTGTQLSQLTSNSLTSQLNAVASATMASATVSGGAEASQNHGSYYPKNDECTDADKEAADSLRWPMSDHTSSQRRTLQKSDFKLESKRSLFRCINENPEELGYDEKNLSDLLVNPITLKKACRVGRKEIAINELFEKVDKTLAQADNLTDAAEKALKAANSCKQSLSECKKIISDHIDQSNQVLTELSDRVVELERAGDPVEVIKDFVANEGEAVRVLIDENPEIKTLKREHSKNTVTIASNQKKIVSMVDRRQKEKLNNFELRILEFNPDPDEHGFVGDFLKAGETKHKQIVNEMFKEIWDKYDVDDTRIVRVYKCLETKVAGSHTWQPYRFTVIFDTAAAADKIYARARLLKNSTGGFKYIVVRPKTGEQLSREKDLKEQLLSKNLQRAPAEKDQSYVLVRMKDGSRGLTLKKNTDLQEWQIFKEEEHTQTAKDKAIQWGIQEEKRMKELDAHVAHYQEVQMN